MASARFTLRETSMDNALTEQIRSWFERSPRARRAYERLSAVLDAVAAPVDSASPGALRDAVAARVDPASKAPTPRRDAPARNAGAPQFRDLIHDGAHPHR